MAKIILYMAISSDGFIASPHDETPWSDEEWASFQNFVAECDCILVGRRAYEIMRDQEELVEDVNYYVVTDNASFSAEGATTISIKSKHDLPKANLIGVIGGGELNARLIKLGLIDEIILDIEPIELKSGIRLFGKHEIPLKLEPLDSKTIGEGTIQRHYRVVR